MKVYPETYKHAGTETYPARKKGAAPVVIERHTVEVEINGDRRAVFAHKTEWKDDPTRNSITIYGLAVRFSQGEKVWPGQATYWFKTGQVGHVNPNIDKRGHFFLEGYAADYEGKAVRSAHNAVA